MTDITTLNVLLYNKLIGTLTKLPDGQIIFTFDQAYISQLNRPTLSLSFKDQNGDLITNIRPPALKITSIFQQSVT